MLFRQSNLLATLKIAHLRCNKRSAVQVSGKNKCALAMTFGAV
jgi:hypothetical protein